VFSVFGLPPNDEYNVGDEAGDEKWQSSGTKQKLDVLSPEGVRISFAQEFGQE
jgi:hypothetical protein